MNYWCEATGYYTGKDITIRQKIKSYIKNHPIILVKNILKFNDNYKLKLNFKFNKSTLIDLGTVSSVYKYKNIVRGVCFYNKYVVELGSDNPYKRFYKYLFILSIYKNIRIEITIKDKLDD